MHQYNFPYYISMYFLLHPISLVNRLFSPLPYRDYWYCLVLSLPTFAWAGSSDTSRENMSFVIALLAIYSIGPASIL